MHERMSLLSRQKDTKSRTKQAKEEIQIFEAKQKEWSQNLTQLEGIAQSIMETLQRELMYAKWEDPQLSVKISSQR